MATFYHPKASPSNPGGDVDVFGAGYNGIRMENLELEVTAAQLAASNTFNFIKLEADTVILGGWVEFDDLDSGTPAFEFDIGLKDGTTTDPDALLNSVQAHQGDRLKLAGCVVLEKCDWEVDRGSSKFMAYEWHGVLAFNN